MATHASVLAWRIPWTEEPGRLQSMGLQRVRQTEVDLARTQRHQKVCTEQFISTNSLSAVFLYFIPIFS